MARISDADRAGLTNLSILDYFLHEILAIRLSKPGDYATKDERQRAFERAHCYTTIAASIVSLNADLIEELRAEYGGTLPTDRLMSLKMELVKLLEGLEFAHFELKKLLKTVPNFPMNAGILNLLLNLKTQIAIQQTKYEAFKQRSEFLFEEELDVESDNLPESFYSMCRERQEMCHTNAAGFHEKVRYLREQFPLDSFLSDLRNFIFSVFRTFAKPLLLKFVVQRVEEKTKGEDKARDERPAEANTQKRNVSFEDLRTLYQGRLGELESIVNQEHPAVVGFLEKRNKLYKEKSKDSEREQQSQPEKERLSPTKSPVSSPKRPIATPTSKETADAAKSATRKRRPYSAEEEDSLIKGYKRFGTSWRDILAHYKFNDRTAVDLKDKARNLAKAGRLTMDSDAK